MLENHKTERNRFTRMNIGEAVVELLKEKEFDKIKVSEITKKAGVSRMTYYNYYETKEQVLRDYLYELINEFAMESNNHPEAGSMMSYQHIVFSLKFFDRYASFFLTLNKAGFYGMIINAVNEFMLEHIRTEYKGPVYWIYCYTGALLNLFIKWEENRKDVSAEEVGAIISGFYNNRIQEITDSKDS